MDREEVVPKAFVKEAVRPQAHDDALAREVMEKADQGEFRKALERVAQESIDESKIAKQAESVRFETNEDGERLRNPYNASQERKYNRVVNSGGNILILIEDGFDRLPPTAKTEIMNVVTQEASEHPYIRQYFNGLGDQKKEEFVRRIVQDPNFLSKGHDYFSQLLDKDHFDLVTEAEDRLNEAQIEFDQVNGITNDLVHAREQIERRNRRFERDENGQPLQHADLARNIDDLRNNRNAYLAQRDQEEAEVSRLDQQIRRFQDALHNAANARNPQNVGDPGQIRDSLRNAEESRRQALGRLRDAEANIKKLEDLEKEERELPQKLVDAREKEAEKIAGRTRKQNELRKREKELKEAMTLQESKEDDLVGDFEKFFNRVIKEHFRDEMKKLNDHFDERIEERKEGAPDKQMEAFYNRMRNVYYGPQRTRRRGLPGRRSLERFRTIDKRTVDRDFDALLRMGPNEVARRLIRSQQNPATEQQYTDDEVDNLLSSDKFTSEARPELIRQLLAKRAMTTGMTPEDIYNITNSEWGQGMIDEAISRNDKYKEEIEKVMGQGALRGKNFWEKFAQYARQHPIIFLLLLGLPGLYKGATMRPEEETLYQDSP